MELEGYSRPTYNKLVHSATTRFTVIGVIHMLTVDEFVDHQYNYDLLWRNFLSPKCRNYSRDPDYAHLGDSQSSQGQYFSKITWPTRTQNLKSLALAVPEIFHGV